MKFIQFGTIRKVVAFIGSENELVGWEGGIENTIYYTPATEEEFNSFQKKIIMKKGEKYLVETKAVNQSNQRSLNGEIVTVEKVRNENEVICKVDIGGGDSICLPFAVSELKPIKK